LFYFNTYYPITSFSQFLLLFQRLKERDGRCRLNAFRDMETVASRDVGRAVL